MSKIKPGQRVAVYEVTAASDDYQEQIGKTIVDRPRGAVTTWHMFNIETGTSGWFSGKRLGFARMGESGTRLEYEPALQVVIDARLAVSEPTP